MSSREEERKQLLQACMAVVKQEDSQARRRRQEQREKVDRVKKPQMSSSFTRNKSSSLSSSISKPSSYTTPNIPKLPPAIKHNHAKVASRKSTPIESKQKSSGDAGKRQKQAAVKSKSIKSKTPTPSSVSEVSKESFNTLNNIPESLQPVSVSESTENSPENLIDEVKEVTDGSSTIKSTGSHSIKSILLTNSSTHTLPTTELESTESASEPSQTSGRDVSQPTSSGPDNISDEKSNSGTVTKLSSSLEEKSSAESSKQQILSKSLWKSKYLSRSSHTLAPQAEESAEIPTVSPHSTAVEVYSEVFLSGDTENSKRPPSALSPGSFIPSAGQSQTVKSSRYEKILSRNEKYQAENAGPSLTKAKKKQPALPIPKGKEKRSMSLKEIVLEEKKKFDERKQRSIQYTKETNEFKLLPFQEAEPSKGFMSALIAQLSSIQQNFVAVTDAENPPIPFSDKFIRENLVLGKRVPTMLPKYDIPLPDIEHPYIPPRPFTDCAPGIEYTPIPQRPVIHEPYYGQPFYDASGRVLEPEEITPVRKFVGDVITSNERVITAAIQVAQQLGEFDEPRDQRFLTKLRKHPLQFVRMTSTDLDSKILEAEEEEEEFQRQTRSKMEIKRLAAERERLERREERRERERGTIQEVDPEELNYEHRRLEKDRERRVRERERLTRARERWEYERMDHERKRQEREENLARERKAEADVVAARRKEEKYAIAAQKREEKAFADRRKPNYGRR